MFRDWKKSWVWWGSAKLLPCIFLLLPWVPDAHSASAPAAGFQFDIPATTLEDALTRFSEQSGISVGMSGSLPRLATRSVHGKFPALDALRLLLADTPFEPLQISASSYRLQTRTVGAPGGATPASEPNELAEVVVTGAKREQNLRTVPISMTVINGADLQLPGLPNGSRAALLQDATMSSTNLGPGRNRQYIRGVADSPFLGPSQATVSVQFDDARATYDAPDPDLRLLDVEQVEILKGPQGPLYGTGALGGVFHIVPRRPDLDRLHLYVGTQVTGIAGGATGTGVDAVINAPLVAGKLGLRAVAYASTEPGWIDNVGARSDANATQVRGGRLALRAALPGGWTWDLQGIAQLASSDDSQYLTGATQPLRRRGILPEPYDNDFYLGSVTARGRLLDHNALLTASVIAHEADGTLDASDSAAAWNLPGPLRYADSRGYRLANQEVRLWSDATARIGWLLGASHLSAHSDIGGTLLEPDGTRRNVLQTAQHVSETALFGELGAPLVAQMRATVGLRVFRSSIENERSSPQAGTASESTHTSVTPSASVDWRSADQHQFLYLRYARAVRPGGLDPAASGAGRFAADELSNVDLGARLQLFDGAMSLQGALFATRWSHIQSDYLLPTGLVGTRNAGDGRNVGVEGNAAWPLEAGWRFEAGATLQHARLHHATVPVLDDARLPVVPDMRLRAAAVRSFAVAGWQAALRADLNYASASRLSFEEALDRRTSGYATFDARFSMQRSGLSLSLSASNLLDSHADTFSFGNPFSIRSHSQYTPLQPRALTAGIAYGW
ncbi:MAG: TonB-dependent receptor plug domain-containing protein [Steroidobacteraceae bacterium]